MINTCFRSRWIWLATAVLTAVTTLVAAGDRELTFLDLMQFRQIDKTAISADGSWVAYTLEPDRGDGEVVIRSTSTEKTGVDYRIERGAAAEISRDGRWVVAAITPTLNEREKANGDKKNKDKDKPKKGLSIVDLSGGEETRIDEVESFALSDDGRWLAYKMYEAKADETEDETGGEGAEPDAEDEEKEEELGTVARLRDLTTGDEIAIEYVMDLAFAENASILAVSISAPDGEGNALRLYDQRGETPSSVELLSAAHGRYTEMTWAEDIDSLAFVAAVDDDAGEPGDAEVFVWAGEGAVRRVASKEDAPQGFMVPSANELAWSRDGQRLFFGFKPVADSDSDSDSDSETETETETDTDADTETETEMDTDADTDAEEKTFDPYDFDAILEDRKVDVWHWNDPRIISNQKERWEEDEKDRVYLAVVHLDDGRVVPLADLEMPEVKPTDSSRFALGLSDVPYLREITWEGRFGDVYAVDLATGERQVVARRMAGGWRSPTASSSPDGAFVLFYSDGDWHLFDTSAGTVRNLTADAAVPFADEDWDYPADPPGYDHSEWLADSSAVMIYDKYDIWNVAVQDGELTNLTGGRGREEKVVFRVIDLDHENDTIDPESTLMLSAYDDREKHDAFFSLSREGDFEHLHGDGTHRLHVIAKAEDADRLVFTEERYDEFPDLWAANIALEKPQRLSDVNPQIADFAWGSAELVEWTTDDGIELQGVLIKPDDWELGKRVPVLVYYYRLYSQRLHLFNEPVVNHRPSFPVYASHGYAVFLPDIRFSLGRPGPSAVKCLTSGIEHLVEIGVADPDAVGLHGHSWSGYQTAFVVTKTDIFAAAVAGAPVSGRLRVRAHRR